MNMKTDTINIVCFQIITSLNFLYSVISQSIKCIYTGLSILSSIYISNDFNCTDLLFILFYWQWNKMIQYKVILINGISESYIYCHQHHSMDNMGISLYYHAKLSCICFS